MNVSSVSYFSHTYNTNNVSKKTSNDNAKVEKVFVDLNPTIGTPQNLDYLKLGKVSKTEAFSAIERLKLKMNETIELFKQQGNNELAHTLSLIQHSFQSGLEAYELGISKLEEASSQLNSFDSKTIIEGAEKLEDFFAVGMFFRGAAEVVADFFHMADISDFSIQEDINKILKYDHDTHGQGMIELNNGKTIMAKASMAMSNSLETKYWHIFSNKKNSLLEALLQISGKESEVNTKA